MSRGGARRNSGRLPNASSRVKSIKIYMTEPEFQNVSLLAEQWDVPAATAAYGIFGEGFSRILRGQGRVHSPANLVLAASRIIAEHKGDMDSTYRTDRDAQVSTNRSAHLADGAE